MTTKWLTADEQQSWRTYVETARDLSAALEAELEPHGLSHGDYEVLVFLSEATDHRMRMCDLSAALRLSPSGLTRRLDSMVRSGWVERRACENDRRVLYAHLTPEGFAKLEDAAPTHVDGVRRPLVDTLGPDDMAALGRLFTKVRRHLTEEGLARP
jgi:DNA-binding MarR family transcriptional regulator